MISLTLITSGVVRKNCRWFLITASLLNAYTIIASVFFFSQSCHCSTITPISLAAVQALQSTCARQVSAYGQGYGVLLFRHDILLILYLCNDMIF